MESLANVHIGTSGWCHPLWRKTFYPKELPEEGFLRHYAMHLRSVEINRCFYQVPERETLLSWRNDVPAGFVFTAKAISTITHRRKLKEPAVPLAEFLQTINALNDKLGPILFQLPAGWRFNRERFYDFLESLPAGFRFAFEFRDPSWYNAEAYEALTQIGAALCMFDSEGKSSPKHITADFIYIRFRGPGKRYRRRYATAMLSGWAGAISAWLDQGREIFCYFESDPSGNAVLDALRLQSMFTTR